MIPYLLLGLTLLIAYLIGGVPFGWLVAHSRGVDILRQGSGNIGATNVGRVLGRRFGVLVFVLDFSKGALPVLAASSLTPFAGSALPPDSLPVAAGVAAFLGHLFPVYLHFRGGKGVATGVGVVAVLLPITALALFAAWLVVLAAFRYVSLASLTAAALLTVLRLTLTPAPFAWDHAVVTGFCLFGTVLIGLRHAANVRRLLQGSENRLKDSAAMLLVSKTIHVLALGLWFGMLCFFTVAGLTLFQTFDAISLKDKDARPLWFPLPDVYAKGRPSDQFPDPLRREQGSRAAGAAVGPLFPWYYGIQTGCAVVTAITALGWWFSRGGRGSIGSGPCCCCWRRRASAWGGGWITPLAICESRATRKRTRYCSPRRRRTRKSRKPWTRGRPSSAGTATVYSTTSRCWYWSAWRWRWRRSCRRRSTIRRSSLTETTRGPTDASPPNARRPRRDGQRHDPAAGPRREAVARRVRAPLRRHAASEKSRAD